jgi:hypothetical protein
VRPRLLTHSKAAACASRELGVKQGAWGQVSQSYFSVQKN